MTLEEEINVWLTFWIGSAFIFLILWCIVHLRNNKVKK